MIAALDWWTQPHQLSQGLLFLSQAVPLVITTDASLEGWGAFLQDLQVSGRGTPSNRDLHIGLLELRAVYLALQAFLPKIQNKTVLVRTDNTRIMHYLNKRRNKISQEAQLIWRWAIHHKVHVSAEYVPGEQNVIADTLSRLKTTCHEWELYQNTLDNIFSQWGKPNIDLFASSENAKCWYFASWHHHQVSWGNAHSLV